MTTQPAIRGSLRPAIVAFHPGLQVHAITPPKPDRRLSLLMSAAIYFTLAGGAVLVARTAPTVIEVMTKSGPPTTVVELRPKPLEAHLTLTPPAPQKMPGSATRPAGLEAVAPLPSPAVPDTPTSVQTVNLGNQIAADPSLPVARVPGGGAGQDGHSTGTDSEGAGPGTVVEVSFKAIHILQQVQPAYPNLARLSHKEGDVVLGMTIDDRGIPTDVRMDSGDAIFRAEAIRAAQQWRFTPAQIDGQPRAARFKLTLQFRLRG